MKIRSVEVNTHLPIDADKFGLPQTKTSFKINTVSQETT